MYSLRYHALSGQGDNAKEHTREVTLPQEDARYLWAMVFGINYNSVDISKVPIINESDLTQIDISDLITQGLDHDPEGFISAISPILESDPGVRIVRNCSGEGLDNLATQQASRLLRPIH